MLKWFRRNKKAPVVVATPIKETKMKYTDAMVAEMKQIGAFDYNSAVAFAKANGLEVRSVIAKARALDLVYTPKSPTEKVRKPIPRRKAEVVASINYLLGTSLASLEKMTLADLESLEVAVR